jgi:hypothetical protein
MRAEKSKSFLAISQKVGFYWGVIKRRINSVNLPSIPSVEQVWVFRFINAAEAESAPVSNGHAYFRHSPWISSDVMMSLKYGLAPAGRGLIREKDDPVWKFPPYYVEDLKKTAIRLYSQP